MKFLDKILSSIKRTEETAKKEVKNTTPLMEAASDEFSPPLLPVLLKTATPSKGGLYPHEILMLDYADTYKTSNNTFQRFWYSKYSVTDPQSILDSLSERGFIERSGLRSAIEHLKVPEIKEELKLLNAKVSGKKAELIDRLLSVANLNALEQKYSERYYQLTSKGKQELEENQYVIYLHRRGYMSVWEMNKRLANDKVGKSYRDILWGYFNEQCLEEAKNYNFSSYRYTKWNMYNFLMEEQKPQTAFSILCEVAMYDMSLMENNMESFFEYEKNNFNYLMLYQILIKRIVPYKSSFCSLPPGIIGEFEDLQVILNLSDDEFKSAISKQFGEYHIPSPFNVFTNKECVEIVMAEISHNQDYLESIYELAAKRKQDEFWKLAKNLTDDEVETLRQWAELD